MPPGSVAGDARRAVPAPDSTDPGPETPRWLRHPMGRVLLLIVLFVGVQAVAAVAALTITHVTSGLGRGLSTLAAGVVAAVMAASVYVLVVRAAERRRLVELDPRAAPRGLLIGAAWGAGLFSLVIGAIALSGGYHVASAGWTDGVLVALGLSIYAGVVEELAFRAVLFRIVEGLAGTWTALAVSALLFGGLHLLNPNATLWGGIAIAVEAGLLLAAAYLVTRRLWMAIGLHAAWNFTQGGVFGVQISGSGVGADGLLRGELSGPALISGGSFGAEASIFAVLACTAAAVFLLVRAVRTGQIRPPGAVAQEPAPRGR